MLCRSFVSGAAAGYVKEKPMDTSFVSGRDKFNFFPL